MTVLRLILAMASIHGTINTKPGPFTFSFRPSRNYNAYSFSIYKKAGIVRDKKKLLLLVFRFEKNLT